MTDKKKILNDKS